MRTLRFFFNDIRIRFLASILFVFVATFATYTVFNFSAQTISDFIGLNIFSGLTISLIAMASVTKGDSLEGAGKQTKFRLWLLHVDSEVDLDNMPLANKSAHTMAEIPRQSGKFWHYLDCIVNSVMPKFSTDDQGMNSNNEITAQLKGLSDATLIFLNNFKGEDFLVVWEVCSTGTKYIAGTKCSGMKLALGDSGWLENNTGAIITFKNSCPDIPYKYTGTTTADTPQVIAANATSAAISTKTEYKFTANTGATEFTGLTGMTANDHGRIITFVGADSSTNASTAGASFQLKDGSAWAAVPGAKLTCMIYKDGASSYTFVELSRI